MVMLLIGNLDPGKSKQKRNLQEVSESKVVISHCCLFTENEISRKDILLQFNFLILLIQEGKLY